MKTTCSNPHRSVAIARTISQQRSSVVTPLLTHMDICINRLICCMALIGCSVQLFAAEPELTGTAAAPGEPFSLWYRQPASARVWTEALPVGNGRIGAMVFAGINQERIQLNEDTLWGGGPYDPVNTNALQVVVDVPRSPEAADLMIRSIPTRSPRCRKCASWCLTANTAKREISSIKKSLPAPPAKCPMKRRAV